MTHALLVALFGLLYAAVFLLGLAGNLTVIYRPCSGGVSP